MRVLVINCGSSSIKAAVIESSSGHRVVDLRLEGIAESKSLLRVDGIAQDLPVCLTHTDALECILSELDQYQAEVAAVGHRVVHGGEEFVAPTLIDDALEAAVEALIPLAPLHNDACLSGIRAARRLLPNLPHVAVFDTAFHITLPERARTYALPEQLASTLGIRRYGFHGISHEYVAQRAAMHVGTDIGSLKIVTCHLGNGASITAVKHGLSMDTSMGMTPLEGLVMGTRAGDLDSGVLLHLLRAGHLSIDELDETLNSRSGLLGLCGTSSMQDVEQQAAAGEESAQLAIQVYAYRVRKYIGAYAAAMGGVDLIVFTGGIGENSAQIRKISTSGLQFLGASMDEPRNKNAQVGSASAVFEISDVKSRVRMLVIATDEERSIAESAAGLIEPQADTGPELAVPIAISARHVHLQPATIERLFGTGHALTAVKPLSQPGQYAADETVTLIGPKGAIEQVRVLGPPRNQDQVEISRTDEIHLGLDAPVRASGNLQSTPEIVLEGPVGRVKLDSGVICAWRHIHMTPNDAQRWNVTDGDIVAVRMGDEHRHVVLNDVLIRVSPDYLLEMHIDTDEANAADLGPNSVGVLVGVGDRD